MAVSLSLPVPWIGRLTGCGLRWRVTPYSAAADQRVSPEPLLQICLLFLPVRCHPRPRLILRWSDETLPKDQKWQNAFERRRR